MPLRRAPLVRVTVLDRFFSHVALGFGANLADGADDVLAVGEDGLHGNVVVVPVVVGRFGPVRSFAGLEATGHVVQNPRMCAFVHTVASFVRIRAITAAYGPPTDGVCGGLIPVEARADHGHAEAVADADVKV